MKIDLHQISVRDSVKDYVNPDEEGAKGCGGRLDIRPEYQHEFVYNAARRNAVIDTVRKGYPLNVTYRVKNADDAFEALDGQRRTISVCEYIANNFSIEYKTFLPSKKTNWNRYLIMN